MIVLGVDPGSHATGFGVINTVPTVRLLEGGVIRTSSKAPLAQRLHTIHNALSEVFSRHAIEAMAVEDLFNAKNARSSLILGHARGVILLTGAQAGLEVASYAPREVKMAMTGNGNAAKEQVRFMVMRILGLKEEPAMDMSDALAVALTFKNRRMR